MFGGVLKLGGVLACLVVVALPGASAAQGSVITEYSQGLMPGTLPLGITTGPDGNVWFTLNDGEIGRITPSGMITRFATGITPGSTPSDITAGPDGALWFTESSVVGRITTTGQVSTFPGVSSAVGIAV